MKAYLYCEDAAVEKKLHPAYQSAKLGLKHGGSVAEIQGTDQTAKSRRPGSVQLSVGLSQVLFDLRWVQFFTPFIMREEEEEPLMSEISSLPALALFISSSLWATAHIRPPTDTNPPFPTSYPASLAPASLSPPQTSLWLSACHPRVMPLSQPLGGPFHSEAGRVCPMI